MEIDFEGVTDDVKLELGIPLEVATHSCLQQPYDKRDSRSPSPVLRPASPPVPLTARALDRGREMEELNRLLEREGKGGAFASTLHDDKVEPVQPP